MSVSWTALGAEGQRIAATYFQIGSRAALREERVSRDAPRHPVFADLYAWVTDPDHVLPAGQLEAIQTDPTLRHSLALLVGRLGRLRAVAAAAASSGGLDSRAGPGFTVRLTVSRADPAQTYVSIDIAPGVVAGDAPAVLLVLRGGSPVAKLVLPETEDGAIQLLESSDGAAVRGIRSADTELVLV